MLKKIGIALIGVGLIFLGYTGYLFYDFYKGSDYQLEQAEAYLSQYVVSAESDKESIDENRFLLSRDDFEVEIGDVYGTIEIPSIDLVLPIVYGSDQEHLRHGVGHVPETWFPGDGDQIFLTGHNDSAFLNVGKVEEGDLIIVNMPYGTFEYEMEFSEIGHETEVERIGTMGEEKLVLMTCYPFFSLTRPEERYFIYANPVQ